MPANSHRYHSNEGARKMAPLMKLRLRNLLADSCLAALRDERSDSTLRALVAFAERADETGQAEELAVDRAATLAETGCFERNAATVRLAPDLARDLPVLRERARLLLEAVAQCRARCGFPGGDADTPASWSLCAASVLFDLALFFEVHELLEREWRGARGALKTLLQGLVQVAVGCHHRANGNVRGALTLLAAGNEKLRRFRPEAYGLELEGFCASVERIVRELRVAPGAAIETPRLAVRQSPSGRMR
jgi:hypothetical protein